MERTTPYSISMTLKAIKRENSIGYAFYLYELIIETGAYLRTRDNIFLIKQRSTREYARSRYMSVRHFQSSNNYLTCIGDY